ncbi:S9 family peptidase [Heyndrickxia sp. NPDC080065]|uniref:S9 family peptidase n=1 Tax=Heyndrickxia sp. NPDC080065 TaxID=3390568 RepID=UPI003CFBEFBC
MLNFSSPEVNQFLHTYEISLFAVSQDEQRIAISTNLSGEFDVWMLDLPSTYPYPMTKVGQKTERLMFDPFGRYLIVSFDKDGDESPQIYALGPYGGQLHPIVEAKGKKIHAQALSGDGERIYYASDKDNPMYMNSYKNDITSGEEQTILVGTDALTFITAVAPDESSFTYNRAFSNMYMGGYVQIGEQSESLTPNPNLVHRVRSPIYCDADTIFFWTDYESEFAYVAKYTISCKEFIKVFEMDNEEVTNIQIDKQNRLLYAFTSNGVEDHLYQICLHNMSSIKIPLPVSVVQHTQIVSSGNLYISGVTETKPSNLFRRDACTGEWIQLTQNRVMGVHPDELTKAQKVSYLSNDDLEIEALLFEPKEERLNGYTIIWPHGGPHSAERKKYRGLFQFLCHQGYKIFAPNFRGSTGYGSSFAKLAEQDWGEGPRLDMVEGIEWLLMEGKADRKKLFLMGGSFGGYMSLLLLGRHADYFQAVVDMYGESDLISFLESVPDSWKPLMKLRLGDPKEDRERLMNDSPISYVDGMTKPIFIIQGANDTRVVKEQSDKIVRALRERGRIVEYLVLEDEGHGFSKKENEILVYKRIAAFFEKYKI